MWSQIVVVTLLLCCVGIVTGEDGATCYGGGSIATAVILTILILLALLAAGYFGWKKYGKYKKEKHLILETDPEKGGDFAFDNPGFKDPGLTPITKSIEKPNQETSGKPKWSHWTALGALTTRNEKKKSLDDLALGEEVKVVSLRSHDFTGLGFNIFGNMREGIFIKDVLHRGPASESGKLSPGDRITSITINFEHIVYEDALTILSYASPYEVIVQAKSGKMHSTINQHVGQPGHPLYKSASSHDLVHIGKSAKKRLFQANDTTTDSNYSSLQKTRSNATTLERQNSPQQKPLKKTPNKSALNQEQLKTQLEQTILEDSKHNIKTKQDLDRVKIETETQKSEANFQKFGIRVLPMESKEQKSPKIAEQNDNNINIETDNTEELQRMRSIDEVDKKQAPQVKKRDKKVIEVDVLREAAPRGVAGVPKGVSGIPEGVGSVPRSVRDVPEGLPGVPEALAREPGAPSLPQGVPNVPQGVSSEDIPEGFPRGGILTSSGIRRDENGIPQEIPSHMMNAAVAARRNRRPSQDNLIEDSKSQKKPKGKAPAPPPEKDDEITIEATQKPEDFDKTKDYESDSEQEGDNHSSVNTIELNSSDITIHQTEENEEKQNRRTASTGDLSKIQRARKMSSGTLERAQSLDITDTGKKTSKFEESFDSNASLDGDTIISKEPRLSLILDGLNTFQRSRLKKSTEWGNLEDAILNRSDSSENSETGERCETSIDNGDFDDLAIATPAFDALVNKIKEIKEEIIVVDDIKLINHKLDDDSHKLNVDNHKLNDDTQNNEDEIMRKDAEDVFSHNTKILNDSSFVTDVMNAVTSLQQQSKEDEKHGQHNIPEDKAEHDLKDKPEENLNKAVDASLDLLNSERTYYDQVDLYHKSEDTNVSDDIKVSRHSLGNLETSKFDVPTSKFDVPTATQQIKDTGPSLNVSNITISDDFVDRKLLPTMAYDVDQSSEVRDDDSFTITYDKVLVSTPDLIKNVSIAEAIRDLNNEVTIEGPTSLTFEVNEKLSPEGLRSITNLSNGNLKQENYGELREQEPAKNSSLTYITEIQVTPNNNNNHKNVSEVEVVSSPKNLDNAFENFVKNFEASKSLEVQNIVDNIPETKTQITINEKIDPEKELHKIQEIVEEQLKKLPEMRFSTSSYKPSEVSEKRQSQIELLRSNFEKSPPKKAETTPIKSRIPIATSKTPPTSPERRDSRNLDLEVDKEIIEIMTSGIPSKYQPKASTRNVTVTSIRNSKIPSGLPTYGNRPPVPPRKSDSSETTTGVIQLSANGNGENSFKQWVFNPSDSVTNISVTDGDVQK